MIRPGECATCGAGGCYRAAGHAEWCERVRAWLRAEEEALIGGRREKTIDWRGQRRAS